jgi:hypothetical protein
VIEAQRCIVIAKYISKTEYNSPVTPKKLTTKRREEDEKVRDENRWDGRESCATFNESSADTGYAQRTMAWGGVRVQVRYLGDSIFDWTLVPQYQLSVASQWNEMFSENSEEKAQRPVMHIRNHGFLPIIHFLDMSSLVQGVNNTYSDQGRYRYT